MVYELTTTVSTEGGLEFVAREVSDRGSSNLVRIPFKAFEKDPAMMYIERVKEGLKEKISEHFNLPISATVLKCEPDAEAAIRNIAVQNYGEFAACDRE